MIYTTYDEDGKFGAFFEYVDGVDGYTLPNNCTPGLFGQDHWFDVASGVAIKIPPQPSPFHVFSYASKTWHVCQPLADEVARADRARLLAASDWTQLPDVPLATKDAWATYRQALRDITAQPGYPFNVIWPQVPQ